MNGAALELEQLYRSEGPHVWGYLRRRLRHRDTADELLQETFLIAARSFNSLAVAGSKRGWLIGIARNLFREHLRKKARLVAMPLIEDPATAEVEAEDTRLHALRNAISQLPEMHREILELRLRDDLSYADIGVTLAIPIGTVRSRLHHAVRLVREQMGMGTADNAASA